LAGPAVGDSAAARAPQPGIEQIGDLAGHAAAGGLAANRAVRGDPVPVAASPALAAYLGALLRHTAGAVTAAFGLIFLLPQLARALPTARYQDAERWLPGGNITVAMTGTKSLAGQHLFSAGGEFAVFGSYTAILLITGAVLFFRRDA
jgi:ABC-2 type transport system permease protein